MRIIAGMGEFFRQSRVVFMTTLSETGEEHSRAMTNFNEDPYSMMWFPTYTNTRKVDDIRNNPKVLILFPAQEEGEYYEIEGMGELADEVEVNEKWRWWYLYWRPEMEDKFWFPSDGIHPERSLIHVSPIEVKLIKGVKFERLVAELPHEYRYYLKIIR
ncbi:MAG: pyridoxamine 5'-phosphate oxidase family protein [Candidatus Bathyarchaeia archaeon]|jgi:general stress protein 26